MSRPRGAHRPRYPTLPVEPIEALFAVHYDTEAWDIDRCHTSETARQGRAASGPAIAEILGIPRRSWHRYRQEGLPLPTADRVAMRLFDEPYYRVWPDEDLARVEAEIAASDHPSFRAATREECAA